MIDKNAYSTETLNTFSFISAYFIDLFYNHLYTQAIRFHRNQQVATITDGYKASLDAYLQNINNYDKELYSDLVHGIHKSFIDFGFRGITYQACIDKIVKEFIPQDYWKIISFDDKSKILGTIITNSSRAMVHKIISSHLADIIDNHSDAENANILQDEYIEILIMEREKLYHEFISAKTSNGSDSTMFQALEKEILELSKQKNELRHQNHDLKKELLDAQKKLLVLCRHAKSCMQKIKDLEAELAGHKTASNAAAVTTRAASATATMSGGIARESTANSLQNAYAQEYSSRATPQSMSAPTATTYHESAPNPTVYENEIWEDENAGSDDEEYMDSESKQVSFEDDDDLYTLE